MSSADLVKQISHLFEALSSVWWGDTDSNIDNGDKPQEITQLYDLQLFGGDDTLVYSQSQVVHLFLRGKNNFLIYLVSCKSIFCEENNQSQKDISWKQLHNQKQIVYIFCFA